MLKLNEEDLRNLKLGGYKVAFVLPPVVGQVNRRNCSKHFKSIYDYLFDKNGEAGLYDSKKNIAHVKINGQPITLLLARDYEEVDTLVTYGGEAYYSMSRLDFNGEKFEMLKHMPDGSFINSLDMPLCVCNKLPNGDIDRLYEILDNTSERLHNEYIFSLARNKGKTTIYYNRISNANHFSAGNSLKYNREERFGKILRAFYREASLTYPADFFMQDNLRLLDELGEDRNLNYFYTALYGEVDSQGHVKEKINPFKNAIPSEAFDEIEAPEGYTIFALKEYSTVNDLKLLPRYVERSLKRPSSKEKVGDIRVKVMPALDKEYLAIFCQNDCYDYINNRAPVFYANINQFTLVLRDKNQFYYRDVNGEVLPTNYAHFCRMKDMQRLDDKRLAFIFKDVLGPGHGLDIEYFKTNGIVDCYLKVIPEESHCVTSFGVVLDRKNKAQNRVATSLKNKVELLENDGGIKPNPQLKLVKNATEKLSTSVDIKSAKMYPEETASSAMQQRID